MYRKKISRFSHYGIGSNRGLRSRRYINESYEYDVIAYVHSETVGYLRKYYPEYLTFSDKNIQYEHNRVAFYLPKRRGVFDDNFDSSFAGNLMDKIVEALEDVTDGNYKEEGFKVYKKNGYIVVDAR